MTNNKKNKAIVKKHRLNIVDLVVFVLIVAILSVGFVILDPLELFEEESQIEEKTIVYIVEFKDVEEEYIDRFYIKDAVQSSLTFGDESGVAGKIFDVHHSLQREETLLDEETGETFTQQYYTVWISIKAQATYEMGMGYFINQKQIAVGMPMKEFKFSNVSKYLSGYCVGIEEVS